jgi:SAM-dependent methyltransferase
MAELDVTDPLRRGAHSTREEWMASAHSLLQLVARTAGVENLAEVSMLDVGCGTKFTKAVVDGGVPMGRYVGIDVDRSVVDFLVANVRDPRFEFHHMDVHNELYNPAGVPLSSLDRLPVGDERFDVITLFSVFTHLAPHDYAPMLRLLRPHVKPDGVLIYSIFLHEQAPNGLGIMNQLAARLAPGGPVEPVAPPDFVDLDESDPLKFAIYSRSHASALVEGTGWVIEGIHDPEEHVQHYIVCRPA